MLIAPAELEDKFNKFEERIISFLTKTSTKVNTLVGICLLMGFVLLVNSVADKNIQKWNFLGGFSLFPYFN